jgi:hypothetical protein
MSKRLLGVLAASAVVVVGVFAGVAINADSSSAATAPRPAATVAPTVPLSQAEADGLAFMREEEKVARDVYLAFGDQYSLRIFDNIAKSENTHMTAVKRMLDRYGVADPVGDNPVGVFENDELQDLYDEMTAQGGVSLADALRVGIAIEKADIADLQSRIATTTHADVKRMYTNLLRGSENHLRAYTRTLARVS